MHQRVLHRVALSALGLVVSASWWGCTATTPNNTFTTSTVDPGGGGSGGVHGGGGGGAATTTTSGSGGDEVIHIEDAGQSDVVDPLSDASACTGTSAAAAQIPLDMVVLIDRSGSMSGEKWTTVKSALTTFFQDPQSAGIGAGLLYFPNDNSDDCVWQDYATLEVPISPLPNPAIVTYVNNKTLGSMTPTWGGLKGALTVATSWQDQHPTHKVIVVLATDGDPTSCSITDPTQIANLAKQAYNYNGVQTYTLAMQGATVANLDVISAAGGTGKAYDVTQDVHQFSAKMADIRLKAAACEFIIPPPPAGQTLDPGKVNVNYTPGGATTSITLPNVATAANCGNSQAWYYDSNTAPTKIILCPKACDKVKADPLAEVSVLFGCKTEQG